MTKRYEGRMTVMRERGGFDRDSAQVVQLIRDHVAARAALQRVEQERDACANDHVHADLYEALAQRAYAAEGALQRVTDALDADEAKEFFTIETAAVRAALVGEGEPE